MWAALAEAHVSCPHQISGTVPDIVYAFIPIFVPDLPIEALRKTIWNFSSTI